MNESSRFERVMQATQADFQEVYAGHPLVERTLRGELTTGVYIQYLTETYHMVRHTAQMLALGAARCGNARPKLRDWFLEQLQEERDHDLLLLRDMRTLNADTAKVAASSPGRGAWGLITQNYYMTTYGNPVGILGVASLTEGLGATLATRLADCLNREYGLPSNATTFLRSHGGFDVKHMEEVKAAINELTFEDEISYVTHARRMTIYTYAQMFDDALNHPVVESKTGAARYA